MKTNETIKIDKNPFEIYCPYYTVSAHIKNKTIKKR